MIKYTFKLKDKKIEGFCPESWEEVTLEQILKLEKADRTDKIEVLSCFTGLEVRTIENAIGSDLFDPMYTVLSFVFDSPNWKKISPPKTVNLNGKIIKPPKKLNLETFGQKWRAIEAIQSTENKLDCIPEILAIYLQPCYDGIFESSRIEHVKKWVMNMSVYDALPYGFFFWNRLQPSKVIGLVGLKVSLKTMKKLLYTKKQGENSLNPSATS
jgi:hypothetical protein